MPTTSQFLLACATPDSMAEAEDKSEELFIVDTDPSVHVCVILTKRCCKSLKNNPEFIINTGTWQVVCFILSTNYKFFGDIECTVPLPKEDLNHIQN